MGVMKGMEFYTLQNRLAPLGCKLHVRASQTNHEASYEPSRWVLRIPRDQSRSANTMSSCNQVESFGVYLAPFRAWAAMQGWISLLETGGFLH